MHAHEHRPTKLVFGLVLVKNMPATRPSSVSVAGPSFWNALFSSASSLLQTQLLLWDFHHLSRHCFYSCVLVNNDTWHSSILASDVLIVQSIVSISRLQFVQHSRLMFVVFAFSLLLLFPRSWETLSSAGHARLCEGKGLFWKASKFTFSASTVWSDLQTTKH